MVLAPGSELGQDGPLGKPLKERPAQLFFKRLDRPRQRRLRHAAAACGPGEVPFLAEREEVSHMRHFHDRLGSNDYLRPVHGLRASAISAPLILGQQPLGPEGYSRRPAVAARRSIFP